MKIAHGSPLFDNLGHPELMLVLRRGIGKHLIPVQPVTDFVFSENVPDRNRVGHRLDTINIHFLQFAHVFKNVVELILKTDSLLVSEIQPSEMRNVFHIHVFGVF